MADPKSFNIFAFQAYSGGKGKRFAVTTSTGTTAYLIPGLSGGTDDNDRRRVLVTNDGDFPAHIRMGPSDIQADTDCYVIEPRQAHLIRPPSVNPSGVWIAGCTSSGSSAVHVVAGEGV